jgi:tetratricopeptide (TPR) repeat protein
MSGTVRIRSFVTALCFFASLSRGTLLYAQNTPDTRETRRLPDTFYVFRDAVLMQNTGAVQITRLYIAAKEAIEQTLAGANRFIALSRCAYLAGVSVQAEGRKTEAAPYYDQGIAWAEDALSIMPASEGYRYLALNIASSCWVKPIPYALANVGKIEEYVQKALALNPRNLAAQYIIAAQYIYAPWPVGNMRKGAGILREIISQDMNSLEKEDLVNIYLAMAAVCQKEKKNGEERLWQERALTLYPDNRFRETLFRSTGK